MGFEAEVFYCNKESFCTVFWKMLFVSNKFLSYIRSLRFRFGRGSLTGKAVVLKTTARNRLQVRVLSPPSNKFNLFLHKSIFFS